MSMIINPFAFAAPIPDWANVKIMLYGEGEDGNTTFTDHSEVGRTLTANGNVQNDTGIDVKGQSILFDGTGDYISAANADDLHFDAEDFCIEAYIQLSATGATKAIMTKRSATTAREASFLISSGNNLALQCFDSSNNAILVVSGATALSSGVVYHIAASRAGTTGRVFLNGMLDGSATQSGTVAQSTNSLLIGRDASASARDLNGSLNWLRLTIGEPLYTGNFTPPLVPLPTG